jgi:hypothetical protein
VRALGPMANRLTRRKPIVCMAKLTVKEKTDLNLPWDLWFFGEMHLHVKWANSLRQKVGICSVSLLRKPSLRSPRVFSNPHYRKQNWRRLDEQESNPKVDALGGHTVAHLRQCRVLGARVG